MACDASSLRIVNLNCCDWSKLGSFNVEEVDVMGANMNTREDEDIVCYLSMEPDRLVKWKPSDLRSNVT